MEIKTKQKKESALIQRISVPISSDLKSKIDKLKMSNIDFNAMTRDYWEKLLTKLSSQARHN